jgi:hypothetical protein
MAPSPYSHIIRLTLVLAAALAAFLALKDFATPKSWDHDASYRLDATTDLQQQPALYGGNASCRDSACHGLEKDHEAKWSLLQSAVHETLACEGCHGALGKHVQDGAKVADAFIERDNTLCLRCHARLLGRDSKVAQFRPTTGVHKMAGVTQTTRCSNCHDAHAPAAKPEPEPAAQAEAEEPAAAPMSCDGGGCHEPPPGHGERAEQLPSAVHRVLTCEVCHGALEAHAQAGAKVADATLERGSGLCLRCHGGPPKPGQAVKQFDPEFAVHKAAHVTRETACRTCHNPHAPKF